MAGGQPDGRRRWRSNFVSTDANTYSSANGIAKVDHNFNSVHSLSARYFGGGGDQVAQTNSPYLAYFQAVPSRMHNVSLVGTSVFTSHLVNQLVVGYNYFKQTFNSNDISADPIAMGFNTGVTDPDAGRAAQHHDQRVRGGRRHAAARARRQDAALHRQRRRTRPARIR